LVSLNGIVFHCISSGKFRRYFSLFNISDIFFIVKGFFDSAYILIKEKPDLCISAGGFVSVPVHVAAWFLGIPTWIHQQDVQIGLANRIMSKIATRITTAREQSLFDFEKNKTVWLGNPIRHEIMAGSRQRAIKRFGLSGALPVIFATGGGTGSLRVNQLIAESLPHLEGKAEVVHLSGKERPQELGERATTHFPFYHHYQFFTDEMSDAYAVADIVISRGGFGTMTELAALSKPTIFIPKPGHQEENVLFLAEANAAIIVHEQLASGVELARKITDLLDNRTERERMGQAMHALLPAAKKDEILHLITLLTEK